MSGQSGKCHVLHELLIQTFIVDYFRVFSVYVEDIQWDAPINTYPPDNQRHLCYQHKYRAPVLQTITVTCSSTLYGNSVRVEMENKHTQLVLCEFRVFRGNSFRGICNTRQTFVLVGPL